MKKQYSKPGIIIEDFKIVESISAGCGKTDGANHSEGDCGWRFDSETVIWTDALANKCNLIWDPTYEDVCYNNPEGLIKAFSS